ncbi:hypothetical protein F5880DRAFT_1661414 [Lentinula raphanica]|nr:hypothetical protein F5880DRAFT_1661414 [Lentinula raphanica]
MTPRKQSNTTAAPTDPPTIAATGVVFELWVTLKLRRDKVPSARPLAWVMLNTPSSHCVAEEEDTVSTAKSLLPQNDSYDQLEHTHSQFWDQHYSNVLPPLSPRSSQFRGEIHETLTDLPYTLLPASESPSPNLSPLELPPRQPTPRMRPLINVGDFNQPTPTTRLPPLSNISPERCQTPDIAVSPAGSPSKPITEPPPSPGKENEGIKEPSKTKKRQQWTGSDLIALARAVLEKEPYVQPHGKKVYLDSQVRYDSSGTREDPWKKGKVWSEIKDILVAEKSVTSDTNATAVQHKAESLVSYWKNPKSSDKGIKTIAKIFNKRPGYKITIAALMDGVESQWDRGKSESEVVKEKNQKKKDKDTEGGEAIRRASLQTMGLHRGQDRHRKRQQFRITLP